VSRHPEPLRACFAAVLLLEGGSAREVAERVGIDRETAGRVKRALDAGDFGSIPGMGDDPNGKRFHVNGRAYVMGGRCITHAELLVRLMMKTAGQLARQRAREEREE